MYFNPIFTFYIYTSARTHVERKHDDSEHSDKDKSIKGYPKKCKQQKAFFIPLSISTRPIPFSHPFFLSLFFFLSPFEMKEKGGLFLFNRPNFVLTNYFLTLILTTNEASKYTFATHSIFWTTDSLEVWREKLWTQKRFFFLRWVSFDLSSKLFFFGRLRRGCCFLCTPFPFSLDVQ